ncbi:Heterokaryon incompatibility protein 6, OR allele [Pseudocercospora fuligena]|uniref:Heterokaryon incompatibility protein 6, OR allele n=1 Tax=Pseudocercospora fuligena TaxID=685502 RepID=A0A8H6R7D8_9PEZI|nr:Heterokaryon incompatibility protein 6, OR allele [Pseudocercospora fuligena]
MGLLSVIKAQALKPFTADLRYQALNESNREIRVLEILPRSEGKNGTLACSLRVISLKSVPRPQYETISYTWGDPTPCHRLVVNAQTVLVPASAKLALQCVALEDRPRTVWIDAVCINQNDRAERASQVALMGQVYSQSTGNLVYLGESDEATTRAFSNLGSITIAIKRDMAAENVETLLELIYCHDKFQTISKPLALDLSTYCLDMLFRRPWFRRVWIIQEVVLAPKSHCYCGKLQIDLQEILDAAAWLKIWHRLTSIRIGAGVDNDGLEAAASIWQSCSGKRSMADMLSHSNEVHASDPRDRVFGLLGMLYSDAKIPDLLRPSYDKPLKDVYRDAMRHFVEVDNDTRPFALLRHKDDEQFGVDDWPSWVPRFHFLHGQFEGYSSLSKIYNTRYKQGKSVAGTTPRASTSLNSNTLPLPGINVDGIVKLSDSLDIRIWVVGGEYQDTVKFLESVTNTVSPDIDANSAQLARTLIAGVSLLIERSTTRDEEDLLILREIMKGHNYVDFKSRVECDRKSQDKLVRASCYYRAMLTVCRDRKVAVTASGHLGLVPEECREGDIIVITQNCIKPLVLRSMDSEHKMLGECYLDGFMWEDERVRLDQRSKRGQVDFRIT